MSVEPQIVDLRDRVDPDLLQEVYDGLYAPSFTDPSEQETLEQYASRLWQPQLPPPQPVTHFYVAGTHLADPDRRALEAFLICESYLASRCGLLTYVVVTERARGRGWARRLIRAARGPLEQDMRTFTQGRDGVRGLFAEMHNPRAFSGPDVLDPAVRLQIMRKLGAHWLPIRYVQPELQPGAPRSRHLLLTAFPTSDAAGPVRIAPRIVRDFLFEFYQALGVADPARDADFLQTERDLSAGRCADLPQPDLPTVTWDESAG